MEQIIIKSRRHRTGKGLLLSILFLSLTGSLNAQIYSGQKGSMKLKGEAPQEVIIAESATLAGKLDGATKKFNFKQPLNSFSFSQGDLQKKHAEESYWEIDKFPHATFAGEIINDVTLTKDGVYHVTVRGKLSMHGVDKEMKIPAVVVVENGAINVSSKFSIFLSDFNIKIPRLVSLKVSQEFAVDVNLKMSKG